MQFLISCFIKKSLITFVFLQFLYNLLNVENYNDIKVGDVMECFEVKEVARSLDSVDKKVG